MKKSTKALALVLAFSVGVLAGCGKSAQPQPIQPQTQQQAAENNEFVKLLLQGYTINMSSGGGDDETGYDWRAIVSNRDVISDAEEITVLKVKIPLTKELYEEYFNFDTEKSEEQQIELLATQKECTVTDITDKIPKQEELDQWIGKTLGDLEQAGFENSGWSSDEQGVTTFWYDGPAYYVEVGLKEGTLIKDMDDYSPNDLRKLEIGSMRFQGFSFDILDNN